MPTKRKGAKTEAPFFCSWKIITLDVNDPIKGIEHTLMHHLA